MKIGYIGLGKMGTAMTERLLERGHEVVVFNRHPEALSPVVAKGALPATSVADLAGQLPAPRVIWLMVSARAVTEVLAELGPLLERGDTVIDGGNSFFKDSIERASTCALTGVRFLDVGVSGGPVGARQGACLMIGGAESVFTEYQNLFTDLAQPNGFTYCGESGAGHFVKMVHNGIEYGMMQALGEGFALLKQAPFNLDLVEIARLYNTGSVIESRLTKWLTEGYQVYGTDLAAIDGTVSASGEGNWTVETAENLGLPTPVIKAAVEFRAGSSKQPSYIGQVVSLLRHQFGQHDVFKNKKDGKRT